MIWSPADFVHLSTDKEMISLYTEHQYKRNTFVFAPIFHELNSKI